MAIERLSPAIRHYVRTFSIVAIVVYRDGRLGVSRDPQGAAEAWWIQSDKAGCVLSVARACQIDIPTAAGKLGLHVTSHDNVVARATSATERIEAQVTKAHDNGSLRFFNETYKRKRLDAALAGRTFIPYTVAKQRLRKAVASVAAGQASAPLLLARVFEQQMES